MLEAVVEGSAAADAGVRSANLRLLRIFAACALIVPLALFLFASWISYRDLEALTDERIARSLDVMQAQALRTFQSVNVAILSVDRMLGSRSPEEIRSDEPYLHTELIAINKSLSDVQSIWVFGPDGYPQVITREAPAPHVYYGDQDYFTGPRDKPDALYVGHIHPSFSGGEPYFALSRARRDASGHFAGVVEMSMLPSDFIRFYAQLTSSPGLGFSILLQDGTILARLPKAAGDVQPEESFRAFTSTPSLGRHLPLGFWPLTWR